MTRPLTDSIATTLGGSLALTDTPTPRRPTMGDPLVLELDRIDRSQTALVGGKAANLGGLLRMGGVPVPPGLCITTAAFRRTVLDDPDVAALLARLAAVDPADEQTRRSTADALRRAVVGRAMPDELAGAITTGLAAIDEHARWAVRSSAVAEDSATASFAGLQDTYLDVGSPAEVLTHVTRCWASLYSDRAVAYRQRSGLDQRTAEMAVVVQRMVPADAAGVLFTAHPLTGNRTIATVEATVGLGDALVSGRVEPDRYEVREGAIVARSTAGDASVLTDDHVFRLVDLGRRVEAHLDHPQDIEWCLVGDDVQIVQSRPITTLYPVPAGGEGNRVYVSVGHQQMMTDAMRPLGISVWQLTSRASMHAVGGRLFVDVTPGLTSTTTSRAGLLAALGRSDPLIGDALQAIVERVGFLPAPVDGAPVDPASGPPPAPAEPIATDPAIVAGLVERADAEVAAMGRAIRELSGPDLLAFIRDDLRALNQRLFDPLSMQAVVAGMDAAWWLNEHLLEWIGERNLADALTQSAPGNVTSEMGLALLDVADAIRPHPEVVALLERAGPDLVLDQVDGLPGGLQARAALEAWLGRYGMRCVGEIDITRPRWAEQPGALVPALLVNVRTFAPGAAGRRFAEGERSAAATQEDVLDRLRAQPDGEAKADEVKRMIERLRTFVGYREHPKYSMIARYFEYRKALLREADRLVDVGAIDDADDVSYLTFPELEEVVRTGAVDPGLLARRKEEHATHQALTPPRVLTSEGEAVAGSYRRDDVPDGALVGLPVSAGVVEGRARIVRDMAGSDLAPGDILVTEHTDPSWTPLFVAAAGLVTEVGGLMTHGAVVAREYGLPAVVGVVGATSLIPEGARIRVHGTQGHVEVLADAPSRPPRAQP